MKKAWWYIKTGLQVLGTTAVSFAPEILKVFPEHTLAFKLALPIGAAIKLFGMRKDYQDNAHTLPEGITKTLDKVPDKYTGKRKIAVCKLCGGFTYYDGTKECEHSVEFQIKLDNA